MNRAFYFFIFLLLTLIVIQTVQADDVSIQTQNKLEYYLDRNPTDSGVHNDSLRNRLTVDMLYGNFYAGIWYEAFEPITRLTTGDTSYEGITQRYFGWTDGNAEIRLGNYYANFNRGLILRAYENQDVQIDKNLDGVWASYRGNKFNLEALNGKILLSENILLSPLIRTRENDIVAFRGELTPISNISFGGAALRYKKKNSFTSEIEYTNAQEITAGLTYGPFDFYADYGRQEGNEGFYIGRPDLKTGDATYLTASFSTGLFGISAEYKNYYNMALDFNAPPSANHRDQSPNALWAQSGANDRGFQVSLFFAPLNNWTVEADIAQSGERPDEYGHIQQKIFNNFYEVRGYIGRNILILNYERTDTGVEGLEQLPYGEFTYYLDDDNTITLTGQVRKLERIRDLFGKDDYNETDYSISFSHSYFLSITVYGGFTSEEFQPWEQSFPKRSGAISLGLRYGEHDLNIFYGDQRGGFVCTEGACREVPPFRGLKITLVSRF